MVKPRHNQPMKRGLKIWGEMARSLKGDLVCMGYVQTVYTWDGESAHWSEHQLIIRAHQNKEWQLGVQVCIEQCSRKRI